MATAAGGDWPQRIENVEQVEEMLSRPSPGLVEMMKRLPGDIIILGVGGKMGPTLARMARRASDEAGTTRKVIGVARFSSNDLQDQLASWNVTPIKCDLLDQSQLDKLPDAPNVVYMAGMKFGSTGAEALTWAMNTYLPGMVSTKFRKSRISAFSTGNIYGLSPIARGGSREIDSLNPTGDYAMSCMGRERMFEHFSRSLSIKIAMIRLNYACEMRYGVIYDLAQQVHKGVPINLAMGAFNAIWQADANDMALRALEHASSPPLLLNVAGPELLSCRRVCEEIARHVNKSVTFEGTESNDALLTNGQLGHELYGYPRVSARRMIAWTSDWVARGGAGLGKPTHFETRDGKY
jgi:nucleoside-diphosphate-sugar epimerase